MNKKIVKKILEWAIYLWVFLLPWQTRLILRQGYLNNEPWEYGTISLYGLDILLFILILLRVIGGGEKKHLFAFKNNTNNLWPFLFGLLAISFLSIYWAWNGGLALYGFIKLVEGIILFWLITTSFLDLTKINITFVLATVIQSLIGIYQFFFQNSFSSKWFGMANLEISTSGVSVIETGTARFLRAYGALPHPNILAGFLVISLVILVGLYIQARKKETRFLTLIGMVIIAAGFFCTFSRAAWLVFVTVLFFLFGIVDPKRYFKQWHSYVLRLVGIVAVVFLVFSVLYPEIIATRFFLNERLEKLSISQRVDYYQDAFSIIKKHFVNGVGLNNYTLAVNYEVDSSLSSQEYQPVHNVYLLVLAELGIFGFLILLFLVIQVIRESWQFLIHYSYSDSRIWCYLYPIILTALFILFLFDHYFWTLSVGVMLFWFSMGLWQKTLTER